MVSAMHLFLILFAFVFYFAGAAIFQWLWNITMPEAFGLKTLRYWVAFRLLFIAAFLTSGGFLHFNLK
ncbi:MAG: hypothetical protein DYH18_03010 [Xanthomonadales bacterium PRO7]|nr:hypothetical protein [Xanthomonadales bacterium PRO7]